MIIPATKKVNSRDYKTGVNKRGLVYAEIDLISVDDLVLHRRGYLAKEKIKQVAVSALVDSGAYMLCINENVKAQLDLPVIEKQFSRLADESLLELEVVGPVEIHFENRSTTVRAIVLPGNSEVLLGAIPMEDMDVLVDPKRQKLIVNPEHPYVATKHLK